MNALIFIVASLVVAILILILFSMILPRRSREFEDFIKFCVVMVVCLFGVTLITFYATSKGFL